MNSKGPSDLDKLLGVFLEKEMARRGLNHGQLADVIGVSKSTCQRLTQCKNSATLQMLSRIRSKLGASLVDIFREK